MKYYIFIQDEKINGCGQCPILNDNITNFEVEEDLFLEYSQAPNKFIWDGESVVLNPNYEAELAQAERERIGCLSLTGADVERGIYQAKGMDFEDIVAFVSTNPPLGLDIKALKIELKANHFYRGNPYVNTVGALLGFSNEQLDKFFETNDWTYLISEPDVDNSEVTVKENLTTDDVTDPEDVNNSDGDVNNQEVGTA